MITNYPSDVLSVLVETETVIYCNWWYQESQKSCSEQPEPPDQFTGICLNWDPGKEIPPGSLVSFQVDGMNERI